MAARNWTPEQKQRQAELIKTWSPWEKASGPTSEAGKLRSSRNAYRGGIRSSLKELAKQVNELLAKQMEFLRNL